MKRRSGPITLCTAALVLLASTLPHDAFGQVDRPRPAFQEAACDLPHLSPEIAPRVRCGTVSVPHDYGNPGRGSFNLAVVVVRSVPEPALSDPVVYINGGPGSPLTAYTDYQARHPYAEGRDLVLVDQRGIGRSEPTLCPGATDALLRANIATAGAPSADAQAQRRSAFMACRDEARARGIDLDDFGTATTVDDFDQVRQALGIARWNVVGESYGTTVAMTLMARYPGTIRSAVLDSLYPPDPLPAWSARVAEARDAFFALCEHDAVCAGAYPDIAATYRQALNRLDGAPLTVPVPPRMQQPGNQILLTASAFEVVVGNLLYYPSNYPGLPRLIAQVRDGDAAGFAAALAAVLAGAEALNIPVHTAVECRDRPHYRDALADDAEAQLHGICSEWSALGPSPVVPAGTKVPTLVLAGQLDPNASPTLSRRVAGLIGESAHWIEFPLVGHDVRQFSPCAATVVAVFIDRPDQLPDASCAQRRPSIRFLPR
jgi:pimeloyl-ACP methyl ester carboxylesterase